MHPLNFISGVFTLLALLLPASPARAAEPAKLAIEPFTTSTWATLQARIRKPTVVMFSATYCPNCPEVMTDLARDIQSRKFKATLAAVVMDIAPEEGRPALRKYPHYALAQRLFAFDGQAPAIRYSVDPAWRGTTPYVVFLVPGQPPVAVTGPPAPSDLKAWAASAARL